MASEMSEIETPEQLPNQYANSESNLRINLISPEPIEGYMLKKRKFPSKGWIKRYFIAKDGVLSYAVSSNQASKRKFHGTYDLEQATVVFYQKNLRIDIDGENGICHVKIKSISEFEDWSLALKQHRLYRQVIKVTQRQTQGSIDGSNFHPSEESISQLKEKFGSSRKRAHTLQHQPSLSAWVSNSQYFIHDFKSTLDNAKSKLDSIFSYPPPDVLQTPTTPKNSNSSKENKANKKSLKYKSKRAASPSHSVSNIPIAVPDTTTTTTNNNNNNGSSISTHNLYKRHSAIEYYSNNHLLGLGSEDNISPTQIDASPSTFSNSSYNLEKDSFTYRTTQDVCKNLYELIEMLEKQQNEISKMLISELEKSTQQKVVNLKLKLLLNQALAENNQYRVRIKKISALASLDSPSVSDPALHQQHLQESESELFADVEKTLTTIEEEAQLNLNCFQFSQQNTNTPPPRPLGDVSRATSVVSSIFFDAFEDTNSVLFYDVDALSSDDGDGDADEMPGDSDPYQSGPENIDCVSSLTVSIRDSYELNELSPENQDQLAKDQFIKKTEQQLQEEKRENRKLTLRKEKRSVLPAPRPDISDLSLWSILRKNIGKDLSRVSMPVALNEPLSALQRLAEDLEYSSLLDAANNCSDPYERIMLVTIFALSSYASSFYRAGQKVFNPILGETFELIDSERNFKFIAEQVSHHPPIAACYAKSPNYTFWQDARLKYKFWGQTMELFPTGTIGLILPAYSEQYTWHKVTTCVHNLLSLQKRWIENYGTMLVTCDTTLVSCSVELHKGSYWTTPKYEITGDVINEYGVKVKHILGSLKEGLCVGSETGEHRYIWRPSMMPPGFEEYYGFSSFAMGLNYLDEEIKAMLPRTDSRFRTDQRLLEYGKLQDAETEKKRIEQLQRDAKSIREESSINWEPNFFTHLIVNDQETWVYKDNYFSQKENLFTDLNLPILW